MTDWLARYRESGVLSAADLQVARTLGRLGGEDDPLVELAIGLCVLALREGSVCLELREATPTSDTGRRQGVERWIEEDDPRLDDATRKLRQELPRPPHSAGWLDRLAGSPLVAAGADAPPDRPLRLSHGRLYLQRYWLDEQLIAREVEDRSVATAVAEASAQSAADRASTAYELSGEQRTAVLVAVSQRLMLLAGGPGTGKTTTVAAILAAIREVDGPDTSVAVAAPTGKAATRLQEAINDSIAAAHGGGPPAGMQPVTSSTIHRLLRRRPGSNETFRHNRGNPLPYDLVVVDEMSMVSLPLMARLLEAVRPDARLVLVGDPDQLVSVEAGAVFGDLVRWRRNSGDLAELTTNHRSEREIADFSKSLLLPDPSGQQAIEALQTGNLVEFLPYDASDNSDEGRQLREAAIARVKSFATAQSREMTQAAKQSDANAALGALNRFRVLCGHRFGPYGVSDWAHRIEAWTGDRERRDPWYVGRPILVTENDYAAGVFNGETGVVIRDDLGRPRVAIDQAGPEPRMVAPVTLAGLETVHAMTIHKSQGSQFEVVAVVLPPVGSPLLSRELLYTAVTRAKERVLLLGTHQAVRDAVGNRAHRASGLGD